MTNQISEKIVIGKISVESLF